MKFYAQKLPNDLQFETTSIDENEQGVIIQETLVVGDENSKNEIQEKLSKLEKSTRKELTQMVSKPVKMNITVMIKV